MTERDAQTRQILRFMEEGNAITGRLAFISFGCMRLPARIADLKAAGIPVIDEWEYEYDERGKVIRKWKKYWIKRSEQRGCRLERTTTGLYDVTVTDEAGRILHKERGVSFSRGADIIKEQMYQGGYHDDNGQA